MIRRTYGIKPETLKDKNPPKEIIIIAVVVLVILVILFYGKM